MKNKIIYLIKQIVPMMYFSKYKDANNNLEIAIWRQWLGKVSWVKRFKV